MPESKLLLALKTTWIGVQAVPTVAAVLLGAQTEQHSVAKTTDDPAEGTRKQQSKPTETKSKTIAIDPRKRHSNPTHS